MSMKLTNRICPKCKNPNYMAYLGDFSKRYKYKCMNCDGYFNDADFEKEDSIPMKLPIVFNPMPVGEVLKYLEELMNRNVLSDEWTDLIDRASELLKEKTEDAIERATAGVQPTAYWAEPEDMGHCSNCGCDRPSFISGSEWDTVSTKYCPNCGAKMVQEGDEE